MIDTLPRRMQIEPLTRSLAKRLEEEELMLEDSSFCRGWIISMMTRNNSSSWTGDQNYFLNKCCTIMNIICYTTELN